MEGPGPLLDHWGGPPRLLLHCTITHWNTLLCQHKCCSLVLCINTWRDIEKTKKNAKHLLWIYIMGWKVWILDEVLCMFWNGTMCQVSIIITTATIIGSYIQKKGLILPSDAVYTTIQLCFKIPFIWVMSTADRFGVTIHSCLSPQGIWGMLLASVWCLLIKVRTFHKPRACIENWNQGSTSFTLVWNHWPACVLSEERNWDPAIQQMAESWAGAWESLFPLMSINTI